MDSEEPMPFVFGQLAAFTEFTDREKERASLLRLFQSSLNCILISPRRWGKSSLIEQVRQDIGAKHKKLKVCTLDLYNVRDESEFYKMLAESLVAATESKLEERTKTVLKYFRQIIPVISFSPVPGSDFELSMDWKAVSKNPHEVLELAEKIAVDKGIRLVVCVDEFQNIAQFDDPIQFQKTLRAHWQKHQHVSYCLYGSKRHMMLEVFASPKMPFYKFGELMFLEKISEADWVAFITKRFKDTGKKIGKTAAARIAQDAENHPYYVQQLAQLTWLRARNEADEKTVDAALDGLIRQLSLLFQNVTDALTTPQVNFLRAFLEGVEQFSAKENMDRYRYGTSGNIKRIKEALLNKEIIDIRGENMDMLDPIYKHWLKREYFRMAN